MTTATVHQGDAEIMPQRVQRRRTKGWRMPAGAVYVGRPSKWGNPFKVGERNPFGTITANNRHAFSIYLGFAPQNERLVVAARAELRGKDLVCWCPVYDKNGQPVKCHADVLLKIANQ